MLGFPFTKPFTDTGPYWEIDPIDQHAANLAALVLLSLITVAYASGC